MPTAFGIQFIPPKIALSSSAGLSQTFQLNATSFDEDLTFDFVLSGDDADKYHHFVSDRNDFLHPTKPAVRVAAIPSDVKVGGTSSDIAEIGRAHV